MTPDMDLQLAEIPLCPRREILPQAPDQTRYCVLGRRRTALQRAERSTQPPRVSATEVHSEDRLIDSLGAALIARNDCTAPLAAPTIFTLKTCPRHCDGGGAKTGGQGSRALTMPIPDANRTASLRSCRTQRGHQFLLDDALDGGADR